MTILKKMVPGTIFAALFLLCLTWALAVKMNEPAPTFSLTNQRKEKRALSDYKGKVVFINFWASWCGPCQVELPELNRLAVDYKGKNARVVAINVDEEPAEAKKMLARLNLPPSRMDILFDSKSKVVSAYNIDTMPASFILDSKGTIRFAHKGFRETDPARWREEIDTLLQK